MSPFNVLLTFSFLSYSLDAIKTSSYGKLIAFSKQHADLGHHTVFALSVLSDTSKTYSSLKNVYALIKKKMSTIASFMCPVNGFFLLLVNNILFPQIKV